MDGDTLIQIKVVNKDSESNETGVNLPVEITLDELKTWLLAELDGETEPTWAV